MPIKNIIFDLGGVLLNIDYNKTILAFNELGIGNFEEMYSQYKISPLFEQLETGALSEEDFYEAIRRALSTSVTDTYIRNAWNAMLLDFRINSLQLLAKLKAQYNIFLFSNTNAIHHRAFHQKLFQQTGENKLDDYFHKAYYSNEIGLRKPHRESFEYVLSDAGLQAAETLFIDDSINNFETAKNMGLHTHHLLPGETIEILNL